MITSLRAQNFKSWKDTGDLRIAPLTGLFGTDSSGKTSILQALLVLKQSVDFPAPGRALYLGSYREFPMDQQLARFDLNDRKFVAVSIAHSERPPILNAVDSGWRDFLAPLAENGVKVHDLCA